MCFSALLEFTMNIYFFYKNNIVYFFKKKKSNHARFLACGCQNEQERRFLWDWSVGRLLGGVDLAFSNGKELDLPKERKSV